MFSEPIAKPRIKRYTQLSPQPFRVWFDFVPKHTHRSSVGTVAFTLFVAGREYGPYQTEIRTTTNTWKTRHSLFASSVQMSLKHTLGAYYGKLEDGWAAYDASGKPITGEMILLASGLKEIETQEGFIYAL